MKVTNVETKENSTVELTIVVPGEEFEATVQKIYLKNRKRISVPGFRQGKAPRKIIEGMYGSGVFYEDAINECYPAAYAEAMKEQELEEVGYPKIDIVDVGKDGLTFTAVVPVKPEVKLGQYKGLSAPKDIAEVTEEDIDGELKPFISRATRLVSVERELRDGDTAVIDFEGFLDGTPFEGGKGEMYSLVIGSGSFIPGFEEQLIGLKAGDEKDLDITFPEDYVPDLAGKAVVFKVKVHEVKESQAPEVDDEFAKDVSEFETLAELRKDLGAKLAERRETSAVQTYEEGLLDQVVDNMECEMPDGIVQMRMDNIMDDYSRRLSAQGLELESYMQMMGMDANTMRNSTRPSAVRQLKLEFALDAIAQAEGFSVADEDVQAEFERLASENGLEIERVKALVQEADIRRDLMRRQASELIKTEGKVGPLPEKKTEAPAEEKAEETVEEA